MSYTYSAQKTGTNAQMCLVSRLGGGLGEGADTKAISFIAQYSS